MRHIHNSTTLVQINKRTQIRFPTPETEPTEAHKRDRPTEMANKVMQVLALAGVLCLLAGQSQAAGTSEERQACLAAASKKLAELVVPDDVKPLVSITRRIYPNNLYEEAREEFPEAYRALMVERYVDVCESFSRKVTDRIMEACWPIQDRTLGNDLWAFDEKIRDVLTAAYSCDTAASFNLRQEPWYNGVECLSVVSRAFANASSTMPDDVKVLLEEAREIKRRLRGSFETAEELYERFSEAMKGKYTEGCIDLQDRLEKILNQQQDCEWFYYDFSQKPRSAEAVRSHNPAARDGLEAMHACKAAKPRTGSETDQVSGAADGPAEEGGQGVEP
jgi:hypothetical protein